MADARAILATSQALLRLLQQELSILEIPADQIKVESIDLLPDPVPPPRITIFLFDIHENPLLKNRPPQASPMGTHVEVTPTPLVLDLDYMICAWAATTSEEHLILGDVLRVLYDHPELTRVELLAAAPGSGWRPEEAVQITLANPSIEEQARIWTTFGFKRFKLSLYYKARTVPIASALGGLTRRVEELAHPEIRPTPGSAEKGTFDGPPGAGVEEVSSEVGRRRRRM